MDLLDYLNEQGGLLSEPLAAHLFRQIIDAVCLVWEADRYTLRATVRKQALGHANMSGHVSYDWQVLYMHARGYCHRCVALVQHDLSTRR